MIGFTDEEKIIVRKLLLIFDKVHLIQMNNSVSVSVGIKEHELKVILNKLYDLFEGKYYFTKENYFGVDDEFDLGKGKYFVDFNFDEWLKEQEEYNQNIIDSNLQDQRLKDLKEENLTINTKFTKYQHRFRHLDTANKLINFIIQTKAILIAIISLASYGLVRLLIWLLMNRW